MGMDPVPGTLGDVLVDVSDPPPQATMLSVQATASAARVSFSEEPEGWFCFWEVAVRDRVSQAKEEGDVVLDMSVITMNLNKQCRSPTRRRLTAVFGEA